MAVDPFHDVDLDLVGMPDPTPGRSSIYNVTKNFTVTKPTGLAAGSRFDAHIAFLPFQGAEQSTRTHVGFAGPAASPMSEINLLDTGPTLMPADCVVACSVPSGQASFLGNPGESYSSAGFGEVLDADGSSMLRVVGAAFEVYNVTEELHKSGSVTTYRSETNKDTVDVWMNATGATYGQRLRADVISGPPTTEEEAKILNGKTWEAAEGCLIPIVLQAPCRPSKPLPAHVGMVTRADGQLRGVWTQTGAATAITKFTTAGGAIAPTTPLLPGVVLPTMQSGAYFAGLAEETSLTVTVRLLIEKFPLPGNPLVALAAPSTPSDITAIQCYGEIMSELHSGYPVRDNAAGDFFKKAFGALKTIAKHALPMVVAHNPKAAAIASGVKSASELAKDLKGSKRKK